MLREYLFLIRVPNLFTVPSNILAGYFAITPAGNTDYGQLLSLILSSVFLYMSGIVLNDYFDIDVDRKERPSRPLASGLIPKRNAMILAVISIIAGNVFALLVSWTSFVVSAFLTSVIIAYDFRLKRNPIANPLFMGLARFLNVVLGGSPALGLVLITHHGYALLVFVGYCLFLYTAAISILSRNEIAGSKLLYIRSYWIPILLSFSIVLVTIASILAVGLLGSMQIWFVFNLILFSCIMFYSFLHLIVKLRGLTKQTGKVGIKKEHNICLSEERGNESGCLNAAREIQRMVKIMILSIVVLDSVFLSGLLGITAGMAIILILIPPILLGRRLYVT
jgi:4-hydroxybenzoate polyprenyltransferase